MLQNNSPSQFTWPAYNFIGHIYAAWACGFDLFCDSHILYHQLTNDPPLLCDLSDAYRMPHNIEESIVKSLACIKPVGCLWETLETMFSNKRNIGHVVEIVEPLLTCERGDLSLQKKKMSV